MPRPFAEIQDNVLSYTAIVPTNPVGGDRYLVKTGATGVWSGFEDQVTVYVFGTTWTFEAPLSGWIIFVDDEQQWYFYNGTVWSSNAPGVILSDEAPQELGTVDAGIAMSASRDDHVHEHGNQSGGSLHAEVVANGDAGFISGVSKAKLDGIAFGADVSPVDSVHGRTGAVVGASGDYDMSDITGTVSAPQHGVQTIPTLHAVATLTTSGFMSGTDKTNLENVIAAPPGLGLTTNAPEDSTFDTAEVGVSAEAARSDHKHDLGTPPAPKPIDGSPGDAGTSLIPARSDHKHDFFSGGAEEISDTTTSTGSSDNISRADHIHPHGERGGGTLHPEAIPLGDAGFMSGVDKDKLDGITPGAGTAPVDSVHGRTGVVVSANGDYDMAQITGTIDATQHGVQTDGTLHAEAIANGAAGFMSGTDKDKLNNLVPGGGGREFPAATGFSAAVGGNQNGMSDGDNIQIFVLEWEDEPDWSGYGAIGSSSGVSSITSERTGRYAFDMDIHVLKQVSDGTKDILLEWHINGSIVRTMWFSLNRNVLTRFNLGWAGWLNITAGDTLELIFRVPADPGDDFTLEEGKQFLKLTRLD